MIHCKICTRKERPFWQMTAYIDTTLSIYTYCLQDKYKMQTSGQVMYCFQRTVYPVKSQLLRWCDIFITTDEQLQ